MNREQLNDRFKLAHHRLVARALSTRPELLGEARQVVRAWRQQKVRAEYVDRWHEIVSQPVDVVRAEITKRTAELNRLRRSSPFALISTKILEGEGAARLRRLTSRTAQSAL